MKHLFEKILILILTISLGLFMSCKDQWEDHNSFNEPVLGETLDQLVNENGSLSKFNEYLKKTGYDKILASSKMFTVWAPTDAALANIDQSIVTDTAKLKQFVANHIAYQEYPTNKGHDLNIKMINGKYLSYTYANQNIAGATIDLTSSNLYCKNGILHHINAAIYPKLNIWEYFKGLDNSTFSSQKNFQLTWVRKVFDEAASTKTGINASGETVYDSVFVYQNLFLTDIKDVSLEDSTYTFFVMTNTAFDMEFTKMKQYMRDTSLDSHVADSITSFNARYDICKDVAVRGKYSDKNALPANLVSTNGIVIPTGNLKITGQYEASNGMVYIVDGFDIPAANKIPTIIIEGENYSRFRNTEFKSTSIPLLGVRARSWASGGKDIQVTGGANGHKTPYLSIGYRTPYLYTVPYRVYWRAVNDFQGSTFTQKLAIVPDSVVNRKIGLVIERSDVIAKNYIRATSYRGDTLVKMKTVQVNYREDFYLGSLNNLQYSRMWFYVVANEANSGSYNDPIVLDYIKLVPDIN